MVEKKLSAKTKKVTLIIVGGICCVGAGCILGKIKQIKNERAINHGLNILSKMKVIRFFDMNTGEEITAKEFSDFCNKMFG